MRVGLLYPERDPISPANWSGTPRGLAEGLAASGADVVAIGARIPSGLHQAVAVLSRIGTVHPAVADRAAARQAARTWAISRRLREVGELDAVVAMGSEMYDLGAVRPAGIPFVTYDDGTLLQQWRNADSDIRQAGFPRRNVHQWFERQKLSSRAASLCCVSTGWAAQSFIEDYGLNPERVRVVGMGHQPRHSGTTQHRDWSVPRFLFVGVDWRRKNGDAVIRAFAELRASYPDATLDIVGRHPELTVPGVTGHGFLPREDGPAQELLNRLFERATAFVLPSRFDPSPIAYLEAASAGLPVIATSQGGAGELLGQAAITVHPDDDKAIVQAFRCLADPATAESLGAEACRRAAESSWTGVATRILDALRIAEPTLSG